MQHLGELFRVRPLGKSSEEEILTHIASQRCLGTQGNKRNETRSSLAAANRARAILALRSDRVTVSEPLGQLSGASSVLHITL